MVKLSGCVKVSREPYPHADLAPFIRALVSEFGPDRCVWASDWPFLRMPERIDYGPLLALLMLELWLTEYLPRAQSRPMRLAA